MDHDWSRTSSNRVVLVLRGNTWMQDLLVLVGLLPSSCLNEALMAEGAASPGAELGRTQTQVA